VIEISYSEIRVAIEPKIIINKPIIKYFNKSFFLEIIKKIKKKKNFKVSINSLYLLYRANGVITDKYKNKPGNN
jgi:hypothetical protein